MLQNRRPHLETVLLKALAGVRRPIIGERPASSDRSVQPIPATRFQRRSIGAAHRLAERAVAYARAALGSERILPVGAALLVLLASMASFQPAAATGGTTGDTSQEARVAVGGLDGAGVVGAPYDEAELESMFGRASGSNGASGAGSVVDDGTLYKPVLPETNVVDGKSLLRRYTVKSGDTLIGIADQAGVSMMTVWWANKLKAKDDLHIGQTLVIPPVNGLVVTVKEGDTLDTLATTYKVPAASVVDVNRLEDTNLVIGQVLILPGAVGAPIPEAPKPKVSSGGGGVSSGVGGSYSGGSFAWPVVGGNNYISQYFHYGHYAIDIAATYGSKVVAAAGGKVVFSGWRNNGGGYQVWISHGGNLYTGYFHMSSLTVSSGQAVGKAQQVGRIGQSGWATGPHLHFVVSIGPIEGGQPVNPLRYY